MDKKRLQKLAGIQLNEYGSVTSPYSSEKYGPEENEYEEELPVTSRTGYEDAFKNEENEYEEKNSRFSTMTKEVAKDVGKSISHLLDRLRGDLKNEENGEEEAAKLTQDIAEDYLRKELGEHYRH